METKKCRTCSDIKPVTDFYKRKDCIDGYRSECKKCLLERSKVNYENNTEKIIDRVHKYYKENRYTILSLKKDYYIKNKDKIDAQKKIYRMINKGMIKEYEKKYYKAHKLLNQAVAS